MGDVLVVLAFDELLTWHSVHHYICQHDEHFMKLQCILILGWEIAIIIAQLKEEVHSIDSINICSLVRCIGLPIAVISYCWLKKKHPDPHGKQIAIVAEICMRCNCKLKVTSAWMTTK